MITISLNWNADLGLVSILWVTTTKAYASSTDIVMLVMCVMFAITSFGITFLSTFLDIFESGYGMALHLVMFCCEIGVLAISTISIRRAADRGTFQLVGTYQSSTWFLIFSTFLTLLTTCMSVIGIRKMLKAVCKLRESLQIIASNRVASSFEVSPAMQSKTQQTSPEQELDEIV